jgi:hypothetical protein
MMTAAVVCGMNRRPAIAKPDDWQHGGWTRERLERMDEKFCAAVERAIKSGQLKSPALTLPRNRVRPSRRHFPAGFEGFALANSC